MLILLQLLTYILFWVLPLKSKSIIKFSILISLSSGMLVYRVEKSYDETGLATSRLLSLFKVLVTSLLF